MCCACANCGEAVVAIAVVAPVVVLVTGVVNGSLDFAVSTQSSDWRSAAFWTSGVVQHRQRWDGRRNGVLQTKDIQSKCS